MWATQRLHVYQFATGKNARQYAAILTAPCIIDAMNKGSVPGSFQKLHAYPMKFRGKAKKVFQS